MGVFSIHDSSNLEHRRLTRRGVDIMSLYAVSLFLHVVGAVGLGVLLSFELAGVYGLRRATTTAQATQWGSVLGIPRRLGGAAALTVLVTGIHMSVTRWGAQGWIIVGLSAMVLIAVLGPALGARRFGAIVRALHAEDGPISASLGRLLQDPILTLSIWLRVALFVGIVFLMATKPGTAAALGAMGVSLVAGWAAALPARRGAAGARAVGEAISAPQPARR
jgi:hypothetical protein